MGDGCLQGDLFPGLLSDPLRRRLLCTCFTPLPLPSSHAIPILCPRLSTGRYLGSHNPNRRLVCRGTLQYSRDNCHIRKWALHQLHTGAFLHLAVQEEHPVFLNGDHISDTDGTVEEDVDVGVFLLHDYTHPAGRTSKNDADRSAMCIRGMIRCLLAALVIARFPAYE